MLNRKSVFKNSSGFTVIEILIIVLIIALLASVILTSLMMARNRAKDASFKSTAKSIQTALVSCCINSGSELGNTPGGLICAGGGSYPDEKSIKTISAGNCIGSYFLKTITPGTKNSGNCEQATITTEDIVYLGC